MKPKAFAGRLPDEKKKGRAVPGSRKFTVSVLYHRRLRKSEGNHNNWGDLPKREYLLGNQRGFIQMTITYRHNPLGPRSQSSKYTYNPEAAEPDFEAEDFIDGTLQCGCCEEIIPGGETYFNIPGEGIFCESCTREKFGREAPYFYED